MSKRASPIAEVAERNQTFGAPPPPLLLVGGVAPELDDEEELLELELLEEEELELELLEDELLELEEDELELLDDDEELSVAVGSLLVMRTRRRAVGLLGVAQTQSWS